MQDLFLNRCSRDKFIYSDHAFLTDTVGAVGCLHFDGGVPPRVEVKHGVRRCQIQTSTASLKTDEEDRNAQAVKFVDLLHAVVRLPIQVAVADTPRSKIVTKDME